MIKLWGKKVNSPQHQGFSNWSMCSLHGWSFYDIELLTCFVDNFYTTLFELSSDVVRRVVLVPTPEITYMMLDM